MVGFSYATQVFASVLAEFPDWHVTDDDVFAEGDEAENRLICRGTRDGAFPSICEDRNPARVQGGRCAVGSYGQAGP